MKLRLQCQAAALLLALALLPCRARAAAPTDVVPGAWYAQAVTELWSAGVLNGYEDGSFRPDRTISAAEFLTVLARQAGLPPGEAKTAHWASGMLEAALRAGWYEWDELPPTGEGFDKPIARQLAVKVMMRAFYPNASYDYNTEAAKLRDLAELDGRYYNEVLGAYALGLAAGDEHGNFDPKGALTRASACMLLWRAGKGASPRPAAPAAEAPALPEVPAPAQRTANGVGAHGWLQVKGTRLCDEAGEPVVLRGMSSHGLQWYPQYAGAQAIRNTAAYGANLFRAAMYTGEGGYLSQSAEMKRRLVAAVDAAIEADLYVIIDWHVLSDGDPSAHTAEAAEFFGEMARRYGDNPAVLYEICNEPNGDISWERNVKPYAEEVIGAIRAHAPRSVILVGSPTWSQDLHLAAEDPLEGENLMYTLHFYAGSHGAELRARVDGALEKGLAVFVSEWGTSRCDGSGGVFLDESAEWLDFLAARGIGWANWSLCDKGESSAALRPGTPADRAWTAQDLSESGGFVFSHFTD